MTLLVLYGPNLNLLGVISSSGANRLTLDKLNRGLRRRARGLDITLKIYQEQSEARASQILQRQRNRVAGVLLIPGLWTHRGQLLRETLQITGLPLGVFHLEPNPGPWRHGGSSIFTDSALASAAGDSPEELADFLASFAGRLTP